MGLLANDKTCEVLQNGSVRGYVFTEASTTPGVDQLQRWFLYSTFQPLRIGAPDVWLRKAQSSPWNAITTAAAFVDAVEIRFRNGDRYVKVNCSPPYTPETPGWSQIPVVMPYPPYPPLAVSVTPASSEPSPLDVIAKAIAGKDAGGARVEIERARWTTAAGELEIERAVFRPSRSESATQSEGGTGKLLEGDVLKGFSYTTIEASSGGEPTKSYERMLFLAGWVPVPGSGPIEADWQACPNFGTGLPGWVAAMNANYWVTGSSLVLQSCNWGYSIRDVSLMERSSKRAQARGRRR